jgi:conjugative relaxase-like TrwC/TraI family protein
LCATAGQSDSGRLVLSIGKVKLDGERYYVNAVADGVDEYYRGVGEAPGRWSGTAAEGLGLGGEVAADDLHAVWAGRDPVTGVELGRFGGRTIAGFDLCFRAPKSVSLLFGLGEPDIAIAVRDAHDAAVAAAFGYVEREAARSRIGKNGLTQIEVNGLVAAGFRHRTSRAGDPHLHTHMLVANMAEGLDGRWRTLDGRLLYQYAKTAGYLYEAHLRGELTRTLGVEWGPVRNGIADLAGIEPKVLEHFSDRRRQIEEHLDKTGFRSARAAQLAVLETRTAKDQSLDTASMRALWISKAVEIGFDPASLADVVGRQPVVPEPDNTDVAVELLGAGGLTKQASSFTRRDVLRAVAERGGPGASVAEIEAMADQLLARPEVIELHAGADPGLTATDVIRRADGSIVAAGVVEARWSTRELIDIEHRLVDQAMTRTGSVTGLVGWRTVVDTLAARPTLSPEQAAMVRRLTNSGNGVEVVCAAAGTGKTFTLDAARDAWERAGYTVRGAALAGRAAQELQASAAIPSSTLARLQLDVDTGTIRLDARTVLVIDEAGMAGTRTMAPVFDEADRAGAKVVLVGDPHQLPEIDAGGVLAGLVDRLDPIELVENRRQRDQWERDALVELRAGNVDTAFDAYQRHGRIVHAPTAAQVRQAMVADWWAYRIAGDSVAMMAVRRSDVDDLNGRARAYLKQRGDLSGPELVVNQRPFQAGDDIICLRNNRRLGVCNGTRATITHVDLEGQTLDVRIGERSVRLCADYLGAGHIAHGYATTIHKAQGATFDYGLLLGTDELHRARGYVGMSRGRISNRLYLIGAEPVDDATGHGPPPLQADPTDVVRHALAHDTQQRLAIDTGDPFDTWPIDALIAEKHRLHQLLAAGPPDRSADVRAFTDRQAGLEAEIDSLADRRDQLASRRLRGPSTRTEIRDLQCQIDERTNAVDHVAAELRAARLDTRQHAAFTAAHAPDRQRLDAIGSAIDRQIARRVDQHAANPTAYLERILGPVPANPGQLARWKQGAAILENHHLGADHDPAANDRPSILGSPTESAELRARLHAVVQAPDHERSIDRGIGLGL